MNSDGSEPHGKKILTVWTEEHGYHIDSMTGHLSDPAEWGEVLADVALHVANVTTQGGALRVEIDGKQEVVTVEHYLKRLRDGFEDRIEDPPAWALQDGDGS